MNEGAIIKCPKEYVPHIIFPLNIIPKSTPGKFRIISDCRYLNNYVSVPDFRMEDLTDLHKIALPGDFMFSIDLKNGYFHIPIKPEHWKYFGMQFDDETYMCTALPFGFSAAPVVFSKVMRELVKWWRSQGIRVLPYMDDFLFFHQTKEGA